MTARLRVEPRYGGPPGAGNGGWTCGLVAAALPAAPAVPEVTLRSPAPLGVPLTLHPDGTGAALHAPGGRLVATVRPRSAGIPAVAPAGPPTGWVPRHGPHHLPTCFVCGPRRPDGLRIRPRRAADGSTSGVVVLPADGVPVRLAVWAALDCPGGWTVIEPDRSYLLGRLAVAVDRLPRPGTECLVVGRVVRTEGRRALVRSTLYDVDGAVAARAEATWVSVGR
ncbi:hypothetical protein MRQ36_01035 [Micromonospora sp. R77]|uniref:hypothetical protein n=1 Tax=Micromonospora sp. R77 TaxID=2925836 RepID=UPI001F607C05|nr:hypothetical protein [Micromonospora sp. R77]MCI4061231.1 hypothetical protein [Micromonospora sp. R77]